MSCDKWAYIPEKCDGRPCAGDCDYCQLAKYNMIYREGEDVAELKKQVVELEKYIYKTRQNWRLP